MDMAIMFNSGPMLLGAVSTVLAITVYALHYRFVLPPVWVKRSTLGRARATLSFAAFTLAGMHAALSIYTHFSCRDHSDPLLCLANRLESVFLVLHVAIYLISSYSVLLDHTMIGRLWKGWVVVFSGVAVLQTVLASVLLVIVFKYSPNDLPLAAELHQWFNIWYGSALCINFGSTLLSFCLCNTSKWYSRRYRQFRLIIPLLSLIISAMCCTWSYTSGTAAILTLNPLMAQLVSINPALTITSIAIRFVATLDSASAFRTIAFLKLDPALHGEYVERLVNFIYNNESDAVDIEHGDNKV